MKTLPVSFFLLGVLLGCFYPACAELIVPSAARGATRDYCSTDSDLLQDFCCPVVFSKAGIDHFLRNVFNDSRYSVDYLPYSFSHLIQFLEYGICSKQKRVYFESTLRLFLNKIKAVRYIADSAVPSLLARLPGLLESQCVISPMNLNQLSVLLKDALYSAFEMKFALFKTNVDLFFDQITVDMMSIMKKHISVSDEVSREQLKQITLRFLELVLLKVVWSPVDQEKVWDSFKNIASQLAVFKERGIINDDELDDLYKSLLESFCHFLDLAGQELPEALLETMNQEIGSKKILLFAMEEQEPQLQHKTDRLREVVWMLKAKRCARSQGVLLEPVVPAVSGEVKMVPSIKTITTINEKKS